MSSIKDLIKKRRSVRTYNNIKIEQNKLDLIEDYANNISNPFNIPINFKILDKEKYNLKSPVIIGENTYIVGSVKKCDDFELAIGYSFEALCLYVLSLDINTVILASTFNKEAFLKAMKLNDGDIMLLTSPLGYKSDKMSIRETIMRKAIKADERKDFNKLFYYKSFSNSLKKEDSPIFYDALEYVRLAPSAINHQPTRVVVESNKVHFYKAKSIKSTNIDIQNVDLGIALYHFEAVLKEDNIEGKFIKDDPNIENNDNYEYIITFVKTNK